MRTVKDEAWFDVGRAAQALHRAADALFDAGAPTNEGVATMRRYAFELEKMIPPNVAVKLLAAKEAGRH